ncbi:acyl-CoA dehydrogenase [Paralimibaculum aggregatum]|uniref:Acyl-CoA dehydrogenase n=1 Tax=Paralimibaculum aggregatum TaxID=3036245 RepID=A0ABQ6LMD1_9RHOB|nr:acyl-CoA dehydrogenase family protein [Limibaculum sp. NKW23]GMG81809.1 acyl-CoA dehydrogenase [Limibaculum sp. NKW23]
MSYTAPIAEMGFLADLLGQPRLAATARFAEATAETRQAILGEAGRLAGELLAPLNAAGDRHPARLENGVVRCPPGYAEGYRAIAEGGWIGLVAGPEHGGMALPQSFAVMVNEMLAGACLSLSLCPLMSQGQIEALEAHASDELKARFLPPLIEGRWTGTMNLSEPQAGSDVGALTTRAEPNPDGSHAITGQKVWISWGDHDVAENIVHLVLARLPDAPAGTKGISLFAVPKFLPTPEGAPGRRNAVQTVSLEEKLGLHGSPTCVLAYEGATGWMVGGPNRGLAAMFTMMNNARLGVGVEGLAVAEAATQRAVAYALERRQGTTPDGSAAIAGHADVRRMLFTMRGLTAAARAICYDCALSIDLAKAAETEAERAAHAARAAALTPIAKAFGTDTGIEVAGLGIQVHGGVGYVEETGAAQLLRDVRVTAIYEGTNGIQAMDLVGRKLSLDGGAAVGALIGEAEATAAALAAAGEAALGAALADAAAAAREATAWMLAAGAINDRFAGATPYLKMMALLLGGHHLARAALAEPGRRPLAAFFLMQLLPRARAEAAAAVQGAGPLYALPAEALGA